MTSLNLATIFGPNLLHKKKNSDKEFAVQSFARAEESNAIISVVQKMINIYDMLFMVSHPYGKQFKTALGLMKQSQGLFRIESDSWVYQSGAAKWNVNISLIVCEKGYALLGPYKTLSVTMKQWTLWTEV